MSIEEILLISKGSKGQDTQTPMDVRVIALNLYELERKLIKAGIPQLTPLFAGDADAGWHKVEDVLATF